ncbi:MAG: type IV pilus secretin PilQ, partial [Endomicrobiia bacterium]|nr:type IV pilus secretin PilQ [Endomicrobiia bacterium]
LDAVSYDANSVVFKLSGPGKFKAFKITNPQRLVIDFTGIEHNLKTKEIVVADNQAVSRIRSGQFQNEPVKIARAVLDLKKDIGYELKVRGNDVVLSFKDVPSPESKSEAAPMAVGASAPKQVAIATAPAPSAESQPIEVIAVPIEEDASAAKVVAESAPSSAAKAAVASVAPVVAPKAEPVKQQQQPAAKKEEPKKPVASAVAAKQSSAQKKEEPRSAKTVIPKTLVTFDFQDADIRDVLRVFSAQSGINIIYGPDVAGTVTITLRSVPFDQAFSTILTLKNLVSQDIGTNILRVMTPQALALERTQAVTFTKLLPLNYAKAEDVKTQLDAIRSAEGRKGIISVDARTNTLIITDTPEGLDNAARLIEDLDKKPYQVLIEAKLVEVNLTKDLDLGINWSYASTDGQTRIGQTSIVTDDTQGIGVGNTRVAVGPAAGGAGVNFPATPVQGQLAGISFGVVSNNARLSSMLSAITSKGLAKLLSNPRVTTLNNQEARILVIQKVPYIQQTTQLGGTAGAVASEVQWLDVGIKLTVKPTINADRQVTLKVLPQVSLLIRMDPAGPVLGTREAETTIMVRDGETVVIGGLIREEDKKIATQVPLLGDIPILGQLFRRNYDTKERSELLVFITPQILSD